MSAFSAFFGSISRRLKTLPEILGQDQRCADIACMRALFTLAIFWVAFSDSGCSSVRCKQYTCHIRSFVNFHPSRETHI